MRARIVSSRKDKLLEVICISLLCLLALPPPSLAQNPSVETLRAKANEKERSSISGPDARVALELPLLAVLPGGPVQTR